MTDSLSKLGVLICVSALWIVYPVVGIVSEFSVFSLSSAFDHDHKLLKTLSRNPWIRSLRWERLVTLVVKFSTYSWRPQLELKTQIVTHRPKCLPIWFLQLSLSVTGKGAMKDEFPWKLLEGCHFVSRSDSHQGFFFFFFWSQGKKAQTCKNHTTYDPRSIFSLIERYKVRYHFVKAH